MTLSRINLMAIVGFVPVYGLASLGQVNGHSFGAVVPNQNQTLLLCNGNCVLVLSHVHS
jgi:hypothetical protein